MQHNWILDVLTDLQSFASQNGLSTLAAQLGDTHNIASAELGRTTEDVFGGSNVTHRASAFYIGHARTR